MTLFADFDHYTPALDHAEAAAAYERMTHDPSHPSVIASYAALADETMRQWDWLRERVTVEFFTGEPRYADSHEMLADLDRGHLFTYLTGPDSGLPTDHPMAERVVVPASEIVSEGRELVLTLNDLFRAVHDVMGHGTSRGSFGVTGEMNAWLAHKATMPIVAHPALWCETRGQSAWTNAWGDHASLPLKERPFAAQKAGWPERYMV